MYQLGGSGPAGDVYGGITPARRGGCVRFRRTRRPPTPLPTPTASAPTLRLGACFAAPWVRCATRLARWLRPLTPRPPWRRVPPSAACLHPCRQTLFIGGGYPPKPPWLACLRPRRPPARPGIPAGAGSPLGASLPSRGSFAAGIRARPRAAAAWISPASRPRLANTAFSRATQESTLQKKRV